MKLPDEAAWQRTAEIGERAVRHALADKAARRAKRNAPDWDVLALGFGAHKAAVEFLVRMSRPGSEPVTEANLIAAVRGVCRGAEYPINDDGTMFEGAP